MPAQRLRGVLRGPNCHLALLKLWVRKWEIWRHSSGSGDLLCHVLTRGFDSNSDFEDCYGRNRNLLMRLQLPRLPLTQRRYREAHG